MAMDAMTVTGEWGVNNGRLMFALTDEQPPTLWLHGQRQATSAEVLAVHVRSLEPDDRAPLGCYCLPD